ncbi:MAG: sensor histidine kinase [Gemmatimonadales bacterium]
MNEDRPPRISWTATALLFLAAAVLRFSYFYLDDLSNQVTGTLGHRLFDEGTGNVASFVFFPVALLAERWFPLSGGRWRRHWPAHALGFLVYSVAHTSFMATSRGVLHPMLGMGQYHYGLMSFRYLMEGSQDLFSYATFVGILTFMRVRQQLRDRELRSVALERDAANARLSTLRGQLQPHFLFNALNAISSTIYDDPIAADELVGRLGDLLRHSLRTGDRQEIAVSEELEILRAYLSLVEARFGDRLVVALDVDPSTESLAVPAFLLQPLVENAVRHGVALETAEAEVRVSIARRGSELEIEVENAADGTAEADPVIGTGLGTTRDRLRLLYGDAQSLEITQPPGRFRVRVAIPARQAPSAPAIADEDSRARAHR